MMVVVMMIVMVVVAVLSGGGNDDGGGGDDGGSVGTPTVPREMVMRRRPTSVTEYSRRAQSQSAARPGVGSPWG